MKLHTLFLILFALIVSGCTVAPPDEPVCRELKVKVVVEKDALGVETKTIRPNPVCAKKIGEATCGECVWTVSDRVEFIGEDPKYWLKGEPWSKVMQNALITPVSTQAKFKAFVMNICKKYPENCDASIPKWRVRADKIFTAPLD